MSKLPNQPETNHASADASLDDRLDSLMADLEKDLQHLDPLAEDSLTPTETAEKTTNDIESSAAQLMRDLNDALNAVEQAEEQEQASPEANTTPDEQLDTSDLKTLDEALASGAQPAAIDEQQDETLPSDPQELAAALDENDQAEVLPETEPEAKDIAEEEAEPEPEPQANLKAAPSPPRSRPDQPEAHAPEAPAQPIETPVPAPASSPPPPARPRAEDRTHPRASSRRFPAQRPRLHRLVRDRDADQRGRPLDLLAPIPDLIAPMPLGGTLDAP